MSSGAGRADAHGGLAPTRADEGPVDGPVDGQGDGPADGSDPGPVGDPAGLPVGGSASAGRRVGGSASAARGGPAARGVPRGSGPGSAAPLERWEGAWAVLERWLPPVLLGVATVVSVASPDRPPGQWRGTLILVAVAAVWLVVGHTSVPGQRPSPGRAAFYLVGLLAVATALMARDVVFFVFTISGFLLAGVLRPVPLIFVGTGVTSFLIHLFTWEGLPEDTEGWVAFGAIIAIQTLLIGFGLVGGEKLAELTEERRRAVLELQRTLAENEALHTRLVAHARDAGVLDERRRMAREIHDTVAQGLAGVITQLEAAEQSAHDATSLHRHLGNAAALARTSLAEARRSVQALAPGALAQGRLGDALDGLVGEWSQLTGIHATVTVTGQPGVHAPQHEVALLRVAQEALANVAQHAEATRVGVTLSQLDDRLALDVRDDGHGFDPGSVDPSRSFGLATMRHRVADLGGTLTVESRLGAGTAISATVPTPSGQDQP